MSMQTLSTDEAGRRIGKAVLDVQREPIEITRNGAPVAVLISAQLWADIEDYVRIWQAS